RQPLRLRSSCARAWSRRQSSVSRRRGRQPPPNEREQQHDSPFVERLSVSVGLLRTSIDDRRSMLALPVDAGAGVEGVLEDRYDVAIADRRPVEGDHSLAVGRSRKMQLVRRQGQENLPRAAQLAEPREDETDCLLE